MRLLRLLLLSGIVVLAALFIAACGSNTTGNKLPTSITPTATRSTTPTGTANSPTRTSLTPTATPVIVHLHVIQAIVAGKSETIFTTTQGMTLYYFTDDTKTTSACTGTCSKTWPPVLGGEVSLPGPAPAAFTSLRTANGMQLQYDEHFLYTYKGDTAPGQTNGQGIAGKWFVAIVPLP